MTPAIVLLQKRKIKHHIHSYQHDPHTTSYGLEAAQKLGVDPNRVFKTLVAKVDNHFLVVAVVPVNGSLNLKALAQSVSAKKAVMAEKEEVQRSTGYVLGGVSPVGQKKRLKTIIDNSARALPSIYISAGRRGLEVELASDDLLTLLDAQYGDIGQN